MGKSRSYDATGPVNSKPKKNIYEFDLKKFFDSVDLVALK